KFGELVGKILQALFYAGSFILGLFFQAQFQKNANIGGLFEPTFAHVENALDSTHALSDFLALLLVVPEFRIESTLGQIGEFAFQTFRVKDIRRLSPGAPRSLPVLF
ncbi:MAG TPA: hypothetical protein PL112_06485, partial [Candidatus Obscuribacter sp.]|nr:hypothetical protein [Candidatus Obscuribacter sp.]